MKTINELKRFYFSEFVDEHTFLLQGQDCLHAKNVIRIKEKEQIIGINNTKYEYVAEIKEIRKNDIVCHIVEQRLNNAEPNFDLTVFQALVKGEKFELIAQKCTELGATALQPFSSEFCQVKPSTTRLDRLEKITCESAKQCKRSKMLKILPILSFDSMIDSLKDFDLVIFAYEKQDLSKNIFDIDFSNKHKVAIVVGSEGGFSQNEANKIIEKGAKCISLGKRILRAETATIHLCGIASTLLEREND